MLTDWTPISNENCAQVPGPFFHGTKASLSIGDLLRPGHLSHFENGRALHHVYFSSLMEPAIWGAELAVALSGSEGRGHIYIVEPTGPFEDDPNLTNKSSLAIPRSRTAHAFRCGSWGLSRSGRGIRRMCCRACCSLWKTLSVAGSP